jgi:hypothetical protein
MLGGWGSSPPVVASCVPDARPLRAREPRGRPAGGMTVTFDSPKGSHRHPVPPQVVLLVARRLLVPKSPVCSSWTRSYVCPGRRVNPRRPSASPQASREGRHARGALHRRRRQVTTPTARRGPCPRPAAGNSNVLEVWRPGPRFALASTAGSRFGNGGWCDQNAVGLGLGPRNVRPPRLGAGPRGRTRRACPRAAPLAGSPRRPRRGAAIGPCRAIDPCRSAGAQFEPRTLVRPRQRSGPRLAARLDGRGSWLPAGLERLGSRAP